MLFMSDNDRHQVLKSINTIIKSTSVCDGDAMSVGGGRGWLAGDTDGLAGDGGHGRHTLSCCDNERHRAHLHCTQRLAGRGDGYQYRLDWGHSSTY